MIIKGHQIFVEISFVNSRIEFNRDSIVGLFSYWIPITKIKKIVIKWLYVII